MKEAIEKIKRELDQKVNQILGNKVILEDGKNLYGTAAVPVVYRDGSIGIIADGELQGYVSPVGNGKYVSHPGPDGAIFGVGKEYTPAELIEFVRELVLSPENVEEAVHNAMGHAIQCSMATVVSHQLTT